MNDRSNDIQKECGLKTYCKSLVITRGHVAEAYEAWTKALAGKKNAHRVINEYGDPEALIDEIYEEIQNRTLNVRPIYYYWHVEPPSSKRRFIGVQSVKQQVLDYLAVISMQEFLNARIGFYQVSSIKGKGQTFTAKKVSRWSQKSGYWILLDVRKCYQSIKPALVLETLRKYVRSYDVLYVVETLMDTYKDGLAIGSFFSLKMAQLMLSFAYHHVNDLGKVRRGKHKALVDHVLFYMDDILLMSKDKRDLRRAARSLEKYLKDELGLEVKPWKISRVGEDEPIDLAGYVIRPSRITVRSGIFLRARRTFLRARRSMTLRRARSVCAYWGWIKYADTYNFQERNELPRVLGEAKSVISSASLATGGSNGRND